MLILIENRIMKMLAFSTNSLLSIVGEYTILCFRRNTGLQGLSDNCKGIQFYLRVYIYFHCSSVGLQRCPWSVQSPGIKAD